MGFSSSPYQKAASLISEVWEQQCSVKSVVYDKKGNLRCDKRTYAQICNVLKHQSTLEALEKHLGSSGIKNQSLLYVCMYELLLGPKQAIQGGGVLKRKLMKSQNRLRQALKEMPKPQSTSPIFPRYVRVNTLKTTTKKVYEILRSKKIECYRDAHVPDLLVVSPKATSYLIELGDKVVLQDKSSCFSALCLAKGWSTRLKGDVLDACAAPGNKTCHLAALLDGSSSQVHAVERNEKRLSLLQSRMKQLVPESKVSVKTRHGDFLKLRAKDFPTVKCILLDPSCSGSGIVSAERSHPGETDKQERLTKLSNFQRTALGHAMDSFQAERIVYSTCSIHKEENEQVVSDALKEHKDWRLVAPVCLQKWTRRGEESKNLSSLQAQCLVRADPLNDATNGFFVACFERDTTDKPTTEMSEAYDVSDDQSDAINIPLYASQFDLSSSTDSIHNRETPAQGADRSREADPTLSIHDNDEIEKTQPNKAALSGPHQRKIEKKLKWKRRQQELKNERLKRRKER